MTCGFSQHLKYSFKAEGSVGHDVRWNMNVLWKHIELTVT